MSIPLLSIRNLFIDFDDETRLEVPEFTLHQGQKYLIQGGSGTGKSVFLKVMMGLLEPVWVKQGHFTLWEGTKDEWRGNYSGFRHAKTLHRRLGAVFQDAIHSLHPYRSIADQADGLEDHFPDVRLNPTHFFGSRRRFVAQCSGGECQRISLLFVLQSSSRDILCLDEPLTDIDPISVNSVSEIIQQLLDTSDRTVVLVTHETGWLKPNSLNHFQIENGCLIPLGLGPPPSANCCVQDKPKRTEQPHFRLEVQEPYTFSNNDQFQLWPSGTLCLTPGEGIGLIGESGFGKSTILKLASGLAPRRHYRKHVDVSLLLDDEWQSIIDLPRSQRYSHVQLVSQDNRGSLMPHERIHHHLRRIQRLQRLADEPFINQVHYWGRRLGLYTPSKHGKNLLLDIDTKTHHELSMGMMRRYGLLRACLLLGLQDPDVQEDRQHLRLLLLDEVSRGLHSSALDDMVALLHELKQRGVMLLVVSHQMCFVRQVTDSLRMLYRGLLLPGAIDPVTQTPQTQGLCLNPYYQYFFSGEEIPDEQLVSEEDLQRISLSDYKGCLYRRFVRCEHEQNQTPGCQHHTYRINQETKICC